MDRIILRYDTFAKALDTLDIAIKKFEKLDSEDLYYEEVRDSIIQRFEYSIDIFWKLLKDYIEIKYGLEPAASPKIVLKQSADVKLITLDEYREFIAMVKDRNLTSHAYNQTLAETISKSIPKYFKLLDTVSKRLKLNL